MNSEVSSINDNMEIIQSAKRNKNFKEDSEFLSKKNTKIELNIKKIKNFVPVLKPKKSLIKPSPLQLNPESFKKVKLNIIAGCKKFKESENISLDSSDYDDILSSEDSYFSSSKTDEIETLKKDYSTIDTSPIMSFNDDNSY